MSIQILVIQPMGKIILIFSQKVLCRKLGRIYSVHDEDIKINCGEKNDAANIFYEMKIFQDQDFSEIFAHLLIFYLLGEDNDLKFIFLSRFFGITHC